MTEKWKSQPMFWCDYCKVWLKDNPAAKAVHERGTNHTEAVAQKLRQMRKNADTAKVQQAQTEATMVQLERKAQKAYEQDLKDAEQTKAVSIGEWVCPGSCLAAKHKSMHSTYKEWQAELQVLDVASGYHYNAAQRYYFSRDSGMYYGGEPAAWTTQPDVIPEALFGSAVAGTDKQHSTSAAKASAKPQPGVRRIPASACHPLAGLGGYSMPQSGTVGAARGVGAAGTHTAKRKRDEAQSGKPGKPLSKEEADALARREAARARVEQRTLKNFGLG